MNDNFQLQGLTGNEDQSNVLFDSADGRKLLDMYKDYYPKVGYNPPWIWYLVIKNNVAVGSCGFVSPPVDGKVEIAYWTFKEFEGQGCASFACSALIKVAKDEVPLILITAKTEPFHNASTRILEKNGFVKMRVVQDHEIGDAWEWEFNK